MGIDPMQMVIKTITTRGVISDKMLTNAGMNQPASWFASIDHKSFNPAIHKR